jgi:hypothetical protein
MLLEIQPRTFSIVVHICAAALLLTLCLGWQCSRNGGSDMSGLSGRTPARSYSRPATKTALYDREGKRVTPFQYESVGPFAEGLAVASVNGKCGYIDTTGRFVVSPRFDRAWSFSHGKAQAQIRRPGDWLDTFHIDRQSKIIDRNVTDDDLRGTMRRPDWPPDAILLAKGDSATEARIRADAMAERGRYFEEFYNPPLGDPLPKYLPAFYPGDHWGYADTLGTFLIPPLYSEVTPFSDGIAWVKLNSDDLWQCIDTLGNVLNGPMYLTGARAVPGGYSNISIKHRSLVLDRHGLSVFPDSVIYARALNDFVFELGRKTTEERVLVDAQGLSLLPYSIQHVWFIYCGYGIIETLDKSYGMIDSVGHLTVPLGTYDRIWPLWWHVSGNRAWGLYQVNTPNGYGVVGGSGRMLISPVYDQIADYANGQAVVVNDRKCGVVDTAGRHIISVDHYSIAWLDPLYAVRDPVTQ